jgi:GNAT superfamily N-acetyltransferase
MLTLRGFIDDDPQRVQRLKEQAGWNQTPADLDRFRKLSPEGCFVAQWDGEPVGCVMAFEFGPVAWIAMMLVDKAFRGRGIGRALMDRALQHLDSRGIPTIRLDATPLGQPLYEKLGFAPQFEVGRFGGSPLTPGASSAEHSHCEGVLLPAVEEHFEEIIELDRAVTCTDRRGLLLALFEEQPQELRVVIHDRRVIGYVTSRPGAHARQIGPCIAAACGPRLLADALERHAGFGVYLDVPLDNLPAAAIAQAHGLAIARTLTRMCRGAAVVEDLPRLFASSSPEKG